MRAFVLALAVCVWGIAGFGEQRKVAITIDDVPRSGDLPTERDLASLRTFTAKLLGPLKNLPVTGYANPGLFPEVDDEGMNELLRMWVANGNDLGNHSHRHPDLNTTPLAAYTAGILEAEPAIGRALGRRPVSFRHPMLHAGKDAAVKAGLRAFLQKQGYREAPVTLDNSDYIFAFVYARALGDDPALARRVKESYVGYMESIFAFFERRAVEVVGREIPQILLLHASQLNADTMVELLAMMKRRGYTMVSIEEALRDPAYALPEEYVGAKGLSWIHRWGLTKGMAVKNEPAEPEWLLEAFRRRRWE